MNFFFVRTVITALPGLLLWLTVVSAAAGEDYWYVVRFDGQPVGYEHIRVAAGDTATDVLTCSRRTSIRLKRLGANLTVTASLSTRQTAAGELLSFQLDRVDGEGKRVERSGRYNAAKREFELDEKVHATRRKSRLQLRTPPRSPLFSTWLFSTTRSTRSRTSAPVLFPETGAVAQMWSVTRQNRTLRRPTGRVEGTEVRIYPQLDPGNSTTWFFNQDGVALQQTKRLLGGTLEISLSDATTALQAVSSESIDLDVQALVPIDRLLSAPASRQRLVIELTVKDSVLPQIPETPFQQVQRSGHATARITLTRPPLSGKRTTLAAGTRTQIESTRWMPTSNATLQRMATVAAAGQTEPVEVCRRLQRFVHAKMNHSAFSTSLQPADVVARRLKGDCTEHAVLLSTLMRIRGIPSRVATGLVQSGSQYGFVGHAWTEAKIDGRWLPFDSTRSEDVGTTHIRLAHSELPDELTSPVVLFLPLLEISGRASIRIIEDR